ncbi:MAG: LamG-like jellyroll fold domain-containing protein [Verrucomicrobiia bacterium]
MRKPQKPYLYLWLMSLGSALLLLNLAAQAQTTTPNVTVEILGTGAESLIGGDLTDPENDGLDEAGAAGDPSWNWAGITSSHESDFEAGAGTEASFNIFDNKVGGGNDKWCCDDPIPDVPVWVAVEFKQVISLTHFTVTSGNDTPTRDPTDWAIQGSNDGETWTDIYRFYDTVVPWDARNQVVKFTLPAPSVAYKFIRYIAYDTPDTLHQINEIEYFGIVGGANLADSDNDGMPNDWETQYGFNPNDASDAAKDANGNGRTNLDEYKLNTDPLDTTKPAVVSAFSTSANLDTVVITFTKELDPTTATNAANYAVSPALAVTAAAYRSKVVTLTTAKQTLGAVAYTLTISNVKDVNNWPVPTDPKPVFYSPVEVNTTLADDLKAYWPFDGDLEDKEGVFDGSERGSSPITFNAGKTGFGQAILLDGFDQYVQVTGGQPDDLSFAGGSVSISCWFKVGAFDKSWQALIAQGEGSSWRVARNSADVGMSYAGGLTDITSARDVSDFEWHHLVAISDGAGTAFGTALYLDGVLESTTTGKAALANNAARTMIGENPGATGRSWNGEIDDVGIWSRVLSQAEIAALYNNGTGKTVGAAGSTPVTIITPAEGSITTQLPAPNARNVSPFANIVLIHKDGKTPWTAQNVTLKLNGATVTPTFTKEGTTATLTYVPTTLHPSKATQTVTIGFTDPGGNPATMSWSFDVIEYKGPMKDSVAGIDALLYGKATQTDDKGGFSGKAGDRAIDFGTSGNGQSVLIPKASFMNAPAAGDKITFVLWAKKTDINANSGFWADSPSSSGSQRGFQAHIPWSDGSIYFDTAGCCDGITQRINANIADFPDYSGDPTWWNTWRHYAFVKNGTTKQVWIDGTLFLEGENTSPLPTDFERIWLGVQGGGPNTGVENSFHGWEDDFAIFGSALTEADIKSLAAGGAPSSLPASKQLVAYWDFNGSLTPATPTLTFARTATGLTLTFTGSLQSATAVNGPWTDEAATSPATIPVTGTQKFYRAKQ